MPPNIFGPIITGRAVEQALEATVKLWASDYLGEVGVRSGRTRDALPAFRSYHQALDLDTFEGDQVPACVIVAPGLSSRPERHGNGLYAATWAAAVGAVVVGQDRANSFELAQLYVAAVRVLVLQHASLGGFAEGVEWLGERYDELNDEDSRTILAGTVQFGVTVAAVVDASMGPSAPTFPEDPGDGSTVQSVSVVVTEGS